MDQKHTRSSISGLLVTTACFVIVIAGMRAANAILVPFLLSVFIAIICAPPLFWMQRKGVPNGLAVLSVLIVIMVIGSLLGGLVGTSVNDFSKALPTYQIRLTAKTTEFLSWLKGMGFHVSPQIIAEYLDPAKALNMAANTLSGLSKVLKDVFLILLTVIFILLEASGFPKKLQASLSDPESSLSRFNELTTSVNRYLGIKTLFSLLTGISIGIWLAVLGVDYPLLWGVLAFLLNYVPNIGSIIAAVPAVLLALIQLGTSLALMTCVGYLVVNIAVGSILEPKYMGRGLGLSTLVVFLSLVFWGWVLGPVGMVLSVPLTMITKIGLDSSDDTRWIAVMLGPVPAGSLAPSSERNRKNEKDEQDHS